MLLAVTLVAFGLAVAPTPAAHAVPGVCPPICDAVPDSAWIVPIDIPLYPVYRWPGLAGLAVTAAAPRFIFEEFCASPAVPGDPRAYAVAASARVTKPAGQWQLRAQVMHWRGDAAQNEPLVRSVLDTAGSRLRSCQSTAPLVSPSLTTSDPERIAAVISVAGRQVVHQYLLAHPASGTIVELALWSPLPALVPWPAVPDVGVFDALEAPLCQAYLGSCR